MKRKHAWEHEEEKEEKRWRGKMRKRGKREEGGAHSIDSRAISAIVRERESRLGRGKASLIVGEIYTSTTQLS